jgi:hypothetical protein
VAGENRWPVATAIVVAVGLQLALPDQLVLVSRWLLPGVELVLLIHERARSRPSAVQPSTVEFHCPRPRRTTTGDLTGS